MITHILCQRCHKLIPIGQYPQHLQDHSKLLSTRITTLKKSIRS